MQSKFADEIRIELDQDPFHPPRLEREIVMPHGRDEHDSAVGDRVPPSVGDELAAHVPEENELGDVVKMHEPPDPRRIGGDRHALRDDRSAERKLDRFADWARRHDN